MIIKKYLFYALLLGICFVHASEFDAISDALKSKTWEPKAGEVSALYEAGIDVALLNGIAQRYDPYYLESIMLDKGFGTDTYHAAIKGGKGAQLFAEIDPSGKAHCHIDVTHSSGVTAFPANSRYAIFMRDTYKKQQREHKKKK